MQRLVGRLLDLLASHWPVEAADSIPADRAATWAALFATSSFGDAFFARCMGFLLHPQVPSRLRVGIAVARKSVRAIFSKHIPFIESLDALLLANGSAQLLVVIHHLSVSALGMKHLACRQRC